MPAHIHTFLKNKGEDFLSNASVTKEREKQLWRSLLRFCLLFYRAPSSLTSIECKYLNYTCSSLYVYILPQFFYSHCSALQSHAFYCVIKTPIRLRKVHPCTISFLHITFGSTPFPVYT